MHNRPTDLEIAMAICCGFECKTETSHCHAVDHLTEANRVLILLLGRYDVGSVRATEAGTAPRGEDTAQTAPQQRRKVEAAKP